MKKIKFLLFFLICLPLTGNSQAKFFNTTEEYFNETIEKTGFDKKKIILRDVVSNEEFINDIVNNHLFTFYGIAYNGEIFSAGSLENKSCWGQFLGLCKSIQEGDSNANNKKIEDISYLKDIPFNKNKKTVIFIYSCDLKKKHIKKFIKPIIDEIQKDPSFDYIFLSLDYTRIRIH